MVGSLRTTGLGRLVDRDLGWTECVLLLDRDLLLVLVATAGVRLEERARLLDLVLDVLVLVRLEDLPLPLLLGAGEG